MPAATKRMICSMAGHGRQFQCCRIDIIHNQSAFARCPDHRSQLPQTPDGLILKTGGTYFLSVSL
jgi:hypothetical protein